MDSTRRQWEKEAFVSRLTEQVMSVAEEMYEAVAGTGQTLEAIEETALKGMRRMGRVVMESLCEERIPRYPALVVRCACGAEADYVYRRMGQTKTQVGMIQLKRPYYLCAACHQGCYPVDEELGFCAGGISGGLDGALAYVGALLPFEEASRLIERLLGVPVSATRVRRSTDELGSLVMAAEEAAIAAAWAPRHPQLPEAVDVVDPLYISMDGVKVHSREEGWKEQRLGAVYTAHEVKASAPDQEPAIRASAISYFTAMGKVSEFGQGLWLEAMRRGLTTAHQVVVIGDGAQWIWALAEEHFPNAIQILDWYHASEYVWDAAKAIYGEDSPLAKRWARKQLDALWNGQLNQSLRELRPHARHDKVQDAIRYFTNNQDRMRYPLYRKLALQVGSGTIESGCKHVIAHRLKQAGMRWSMSRLQALAKLRTRLKSDRWQQTLDLRPPPARSCRRLAA